MEGRAHDRLPDHPVDRVDRRRRHLRHRPGKKPPGAGPRPDDHPRRPDRRHLRRLGRRDRARRRRRAPARSTCSSATAASRSRRSPTTASRSSSPAGSRSPFGLQAFLIVGGIIRLIPLTGDHAAVRELRRLVDRLELPHAGAPPDGVRPRPPRGGGREPPDRVALSALRHRRSRVLITLTAYWQIWAADSLATRRDNARLVYRQLPIKRGLIYAANGRTVLATNSARRRNGLTLYLRRYPYAAALRARRRLQHRRQRPHRHRAGRERLPDGLQQRPRDAVRLARRPDAPAETVTGDNVVTSLSVPAAAGRRSGHGAARGAVVAIDPHTGRVLAMYSSPSFPPEHGRPQLHRLGSGRRRAAAQPRHPGPLRARIDLQDRDGHGRARHRPVRARRPRSTAGPLHHRAGPPALQRRHRGRRLGLARRRAHLLGQHGVRADRPAARPGAARGDDAAVRVLPGAAAQLPVRRDGVERPVRPPRPSAAAARPVDVARVAIGQERLLATPLQMAEVAATIANGGERMRPTLVDRVVSPDGKTVYTNHPEPLERVMSPQSAPELTGMMRRWWTRARGSRRTSEP